MSAMKELYTLTQFMHEEFPAAISGWGEVEYIGHSGFIVYYQNDPVLEVDDYDDFAELIRAWCHRVKDTPKVRNTYWVSFANDYLHDPYHADYDAEILDSIIRLGSFGEL